MQEYSEVEQLRQQVQTIRRWGKFLAILCLLIVVAVVLMAAVPSQQSADAMSPQFDTVRAHHFSVVDEKGVERIHVGYPVPDPMVEGKRRPRREKQAGIILSNAEGNEVGGWGIFDDKSQVLCFDYTTPGGASGERLCLIVWQNGKAEINIYDERVKGYVKALSLTRDGVRLFDSTRKERARLRLEDDGSPKFDFIGDKGQSLVALPEPKKPAGQQ